MSTDVTASAATAAQGEPPVELITLTIDDVEVSVPKGTLVIRASELVGTEIPRFCDHPLLKPVGACRQCMVEVPDAGNGRPMPKPQASCTLEAAPGMVVRTQVTSEMADKAQKGQLEFLLANHPLDCPTCDKGGECPLQNQSLSHGHGESRFIEEKRLFPKPLNLSSQILLDRERCVLCQRCTRFSDEIAGDRFIGLLERGAKQQIGIAEGEPFGSYFSGNTIQICPVGALTSEDYRFRSRPFDLVSTPSVAEHDSCGSAIRIDHRRGRVMRRLAGDDPEVNEEWISDKDRFAFYWPTQSDRLSAPLVRNQETGELEPSSWPAALAIAARGLNAATNPAVLTGGRLTVEDAYAYSKFARVALKTNNIDFRTRPSAKEENEFLATHVAGTPVDVTFAGLERASKVVLVGLDPEDEAPVLFLRLRKAARKGVKVVSIASHLTRGAHKMAAELVAVAPGAEPEAIEALDLDANSVILVGERLGSVAGGYSAVAAIAESSGAKFAWVPRRAGDRSAVDAGCASNLLPGGRAASLAEARADVAAAWGVDAVPSTAGLDTEGIIAAASAHQVDALVVGGLEVADLPDPIAARAALSEVGFLVSLEVRESEVTALADVVLPVAAPIEKAGTFINWEGRQRPFDAVLPSPNVIPDLRVLAGIAEELGRPIGIRTVPQAAAELRELGVWDGKRPAFRARKQGKIANKAGTVALDTWRTMVDGGRGQDGASAYQETARPAVLRASAETLAAHGVTDGGQVTIIGPAGSVTVTAEEADVVDAVAWLPQNAAGLRLIETIGAQAMDRVRLTGGEA